MDPIVLPILAVAVAAALFAAYRAGAHRTPPADAPDLRDEALQLLERRLADGEASVSRAVETVLHLADDKLGERLAEGDRAFAVHSSVIETALVEQRRELERVNHLVVELQRERAAQHGELKNGLEEAARQSAALAGTTAQLRQALASPKARGQWGERMADDVLRLAGLREGINYRKQLALPCGTIPDVTFLMPDDRLLCMDVKFPVDNYLRHLEAESDAEATRCRDAFLKDVRGRIREVTTRGYVDPEHTVDFVLLFIPNEAVYSFVHEHDPRIADDALHQRVILCSPFTLFAVVGVVRQAMESFQLGRTSDQILKVLGGFRGEWDKFCDRLDKLGNNLRTVENSYAELSGARRRQLERQLDRIDDLRDERGLDGDDDSDGDGDVVHLRDVSVSEVAG